MCKPFGKGQLVLLLSVGVHDVQSNSSDQNNTLQNVLDEGINTDHGKAVEQGDQEDTAEHGADDVALAACQGDTADDGGDNCVELVVLAVGNSNGVQTGHQNQAAEGSGDGSQDESTKLVELHVDAGEECSFCGAANCEDITANLGVGQQQLCNDIQQHHDDGTDGDLIPEPIATAQETDGFGHVGDGHSLSDQLSNTVADILGTQSCNQGRNADVGNQETIDGTDSQADQEHTHNRNRNRYAIILHQQAADAGGQTDHTAQGNIESAGQHDDCLAQSHDTNGGNLQQDVLPVCPGQEVLLAVKLDQAESLVGKLDLQRILHVVILHPVFPAGSQFNDEFIIVIICFRIRRVKFVVSRLQPRRAIAGGQVLPQGMNVGIPILRHLKEQISKTLLDRIGYGIRLRRINHAQVVALHPYGVERGILICREGILGLVFGCLRIRRGRPAQEDMVFPAAPAVGQRDRLPGIDHLRFNAAVTAAETGHLVFSTLHTTGAAETIDRIIDVYPPHSQGQIRSQLANNIVGIISQTLVPTADGRGRCAALEILAATDAISAMIREGKIHQIPGTIATGKAHGMHTLDQDLARLVRMGKITNEVALSRCQDPNEYKRYLDMGI